jgi:hypothetical protein
MIEIPNELFPVMAFFFAVIVGRIGTIIADKFRKDDVSIDISTQVTSNTSADEQHAVAKKG